MSSAAVSTQPTSTGEGASKRRSIFKPSTWKRGLGGGDAGLDGPNGEGVTGLHTIDGVETGAPLTTLVSDEEKTHAGGEKAATAGSSDQAQPSRTQAPSQPLPPQTSTQPSASKTAALPDSGIPFHADSEGRILFFRQDQANYHLSNSSPHPIYYNNVRYPTAEHLFQSLKFLDTHPDIAAKVRRAKTPSEAMRLARSHTSLYPPGWFSDGLNVKIMHDVVLVKFSQWGKLREALLETDERVLINDSPTDVFWGQGPGTGRNVLGKVLMGVREVLRINSGVRVGSAAKTM